MRIRDINTSVTFRDIEILRGLLRTKKLTEKQSMALLRLLSTYSSKIKDKII